MVGGSAWTVERAVQATSAPRLAVFALFALVVAGSARTDADADLWGHLTFGRDIVHASAVIQHDTYSFTSDRPWVNHEWLAEVLMWQAWRLGGSAGVVAAKLTVILVTLGIVWRSIRGTGVTSGLAVILAVIAWLGILPRFTTLRPQIFSALLFAVLLAVLADVDRRQRVSAAWALPFVFAAWVNLHGGWLVGAGVLAIWILIAFVERRLAWDQLAVLAAAGVLSAAGTLVNPYGWRLWKFLWTTVGFGREDILDWQPIAHVPAHFVPWLLVTAVVLVVGWIRRPAFGPAAWLLPALLWLATLKVNRLDAFFALAVVMLPDFGRSLPRRVCLQADVRGLKSALHDTGNTLPGERSARYSEPTRTGPAGNANRADAIGRIAVGSMAALVVSVIAATHVAREAGCIRIGETPAHPEPAAAQFVSENALRGRMLTFYDYGEYAIWHFAPAIKISLDGRRETVYSDAVLEAHQQFFESPGEHPDFPSRLRADHVWLPNYIAASQTLRSVGYIEVFRGPRSTIWSRALLPTQTSRLTSLPPRCFPGP